jgi:uncharacterized membrane protein
LQLKRNADLVTTGLLAAGGVLVIQYAPYAYARLAFALPLLLVLPGYAITQALFADRPRSPSQLCLLTIGLSLSVAILAALVLSLATNGLRVGSWLTVMVAIVLGACLVALRRRQALKSELPSPTPLPEPVRVRARDVVLLVIAAVVLVGAVVFARTPLPAKNVQGYTALSILQSSVEAPPTVRVNVTSQELRTRVYRIEVTSETKVVYGRRIELVPGQSWSTTVRIPTPTRDEPVRVQAAIYWNYEPDVKYRSVHLWVGSSATRGR